MSTMYKRMQSVFRQKGFKFFNKGEYNLNIVGVRSHDTASNRFVDSLYVLYLVKGEQNAICFPITTVPGKYYLENPMVEEGTAIVKPGQYPSLWKIGQHKGYDALVQRRMITVYRDKDADNIPTAAGEEYHGWFGINCHRANEKRKSIQVNKWSAGCQVFADPLDFNIFMALCYKAASLTGNSFTYTLINKADLWEC